MKSILIFFLIVSVGLGAGVYFYETQIASPNAADALVKSKTKRQPKVLARSEAFVKKPSLSRAKTEDTMTAPVKPRRVVTLGDHGGIDKKQSKERIKKQIEIEQSIKNTIRKSVSLEIQKAVVTEISKKR